MAHDYDNYKALLERARKKLPEKVKEHSRFEVPRCDVFYEGKTTVLRNFADIADVLNRAQEHLLGYLLHELGTAGNIEGRRVLLKGKVPERQIGERIKDYTQTFVLCLECGKPDTHLKKEGRVLILKCDACGAHRPVTVKITKEQEEKGIAEGKIYTVTVQDISQRGDGVAKINHHVVFIPNVTKGSVIKIKIDKISGNTAFAHEVRD